LRADTPKGLRMRLSWRLPVASMWALVACNSLPPPIGAPDASSDANTGSDVIVNGDAATDADGAAGSDAGPCTLTMPPPDPTCAACLQSSCCAAANACLGSSDCVNYVSCDLACTPSDAGASDAAASADSGEGAGFACYKACIMQYPNGVNDGIVLIDCEQNACAGQCN